MYLCNANPRYYIRIGDKKGGKVKMKLLSRDGQKLNRWIRNEPLGSIKFYFSPAMLHASPQILKEKLASFGHEMKTSIPSLPQMASQLGSGLSNLKWTMPPLRKGAPVRVGRNPLMVPS